MSNKNNVFGSKKPKRIPKWKVSEEHRLIRLLFFLEDFKFNNIKTKNAISKNNNFVWGNASHFLLASLWYLLVKWGIKIIK